MDYIILRVERPVGAALRTPSPFWYLAAARTVRRRLKTEEAAKAGDEHEEPKNGGQLSQQEPGYLRNRMQNKKDSVCRQC